MTMKPAKKLLAILLPMSIMLCAAFGFGVNAIADEQPLNEVSLSVNENIVSHFYLDEGYYADRNGVSIRYSYNNGDTQEKSEIVSDVIPFADARNSAGEIQIDVAQASAQIAEPITVEILNSSNEAVDTVEYKAKDYCDSVIGMSDSDLATFTTHGAKLQKLCKSIIAYAKSSQGLFPEYMALEGSVAIDDDFSSALELDSASYDASGYTKTDGANIGFKTASFMCESTAKMRFYLKVINEGDSTVYDDPTVTLPEGASIVKGTDGAGSYYFQVNDIKPVDFDERITIEYAGASITMSVLDYAGKVIDSTETSAELKSLARALIRYNENAEAFFMAPATVFVPAVAATCTEAGNEAYYALGGEAYADADATTPINPTIAALGHSYNSVVTAPSCTTGGFTTYTCSRCGDSYTGDETSALGHSPAAAVQEDVVAATCVTAGSYNSVVYCTVCGEKLSTTPQTIPATGVHTAAPPVEENRVEPTCTEDGSYDEVDYCSVCGAEIMRSQVPIDALGHNLGEWTVTTAAVDATCTTAGTTAIETKSCSRCDYYETRGGDAVAALGHSWNAWTVTTPAVAATCTTAGSTAIETRTCSRCSTQETRGGDAVASLGHSYGDWTVTTGATLTNGGAETRSCTRGDDMQNRTVSNFTIKLPNTSTYLYRVGNVNAVKLGTLFDNASGADISNVTATVTNIDGNASGSFTANNSDWRESTVKFNNTGIVTLTLKHGTTTSATIKFEVVTATNYTEGQTLGSTNTVLLGNTVLPASSGNVAAINLTNKNLYGNGFTINATSSNISTKTHGVIQLNNSIMDNVIINGPTFNKYEGTFGNDYFSSVIWVFGGTDTVISNCHIEGASSPVRIMGDALIKDTVLAGGIFGNMEIRSGNVKVDGVTTINKQNGLGIVFSTSCSLGSSITIDGELTQHNFIASNASMSCTEASTLKSKMFESTYSKYQFTSGSTNYVNAGIISMTGNVGASDIIDNRADKKNYSGMTATMSVLNLSVDGYVYTMENTDSSMLETSYTEPAYTPTSQQPTAPTFTWSVPSTLNVAAGGDNHFYKDSNGVLQVQFLADNTKTFNALSLPSVTKYNHSITPTVTCKDKNGMPVTVTNGNVTLTSAGEYTLTYTYADNYIYNENGVKTSDTITYTKDVKINVNVKKNAPNAVITCTSNTGTLIWGTAGSSYDRDYQPAAPIFDNMTITDYDDNGNPYTVLDGENQAAFLSSIASVVADSDNKTGFTINFPDGTKLAIKCGAPYNSGTLQFKKYNNKFYMAGSVAHNNPVVETWKVNSYTYTGRNGVAVSYSTVRSFTSTTTTDNYSLSNLSSNKFLIYDTQGGSLPAGVASYTGTSPATLPTPIPPSEEYTFSNWNTKADGTGTARNAGTSYSFSSTVTLYAIWNKSVTVSFDKNSATASAVSDVVGNYNSQGTLPAAPANSNDKLWFMGWYDAKSGGTKIGNAGGSFTIPTVDTTYYAQWGVVRRVTYNANGGTISPATADYTDTALTLPEPENGDMTFEGWFTEAEGGTLIGKGGASYTPSDDIELFAHWSDNILVTFDANGGTSGESSLTYDKVTPITLPNATRAGYQFNGWYTAASGGTRVGGAGASYAPGAKITLYAQWTAYVVTYDANGGSVSPASAQGVVTLPTPTWEGHNFSGWYTETSGDTKVGAAGASYTPTADITLHAQWSIASYKVTITQNNSGTVSVVNVDTGAAVTNGQSVAYGTLMKATPTYGSDTKDFGVKYDSANYQLYSDAECTTKKNNSETGDYYFRMPAGAITITVDSKSNSCVTADTLITLADGSQKRIDELNGDEKLLVWNLETGAYDSAPIVFIDDTDEEKEYNVIHLYFSDGTETKDISEHGYFNLDLGKYVYITESNYRDYIGNRFVKQADLENNTWDEVILVDSEITREVVKPYESNTADHICFFVDGMLSMPGGITGLFNIFDVDTATMTYDFEAMQRDIETYGLYTYDDFKDIISEDAFEAFNGAYLKVAVGKGIVTWDDICKLAEKYSPFLEGSNE